MTFFKKIKNNKGVDLQLSVVIMLLIFTLSIFMAIDFWISSSTKIILIKELQSAEVYCLVKELQDSYDELRRIPSDQVLSTDFTSEQERALKRYGTSGGTKGSTLPGEIYSRLENIAYLKDYKVNDIQGLRPALGEFGIYTDLTYSTNTMIRSPEQIMYMFREAADINPTAGKDINLTVTAKVFPITWRNGSATVQ